MSPLSGLLERADLYIDGSLRPAAGGDRFEDLDPSSGSALAEVAEAGDADVEEAIAAARAAQKPWADRPPRERGRILSAIAHRIREEAESLAVLESEDTGKPLSQAKVDVEIAAQYFEFYGGFADKLYGDTIPLDGDRFAATLREPLGVTGHIIPWNYPLQIGARTTAPALMAGNTSVVKPASEAPLTTIVLARLAVEAGLPPGVLNVVPGAGTGAGAYLASSDDIDHISFTGGVETGRRVMRAAAENLKPSTMELGGKSPSIVLQDANLDRAVPVLTRALIQNAGQTCSAGTRIIVHDDIHDALVERLVDAFGSVALGAGVDDPDMGPLISGTQLRRVVEYMTVAQEEGATAAVGGSRADVAGHTGGYFFAPTLLVGASPEMRIAREEIFGPVLTVLTFSDLEEAVTIANGTEYGLIASVWTSNIDRAIWLSRRIDAGQIYVNSYGAGGGVALPFGGYGRSGFGREKGLEAVREYTHTKTLAFEVDPAF